MEGGAFHAETGRLTLRENDPVKTDDIDWDSDEQTVEFEMEGTGCAEDGAGVLKFAATQSPNNSEKCRDQIFSDDSH